MATKATAKKTSISALSNLRDEVVECIMDQLQDNGFLAPRLTDDDCARTDIASAIERGINQCLRD